MQPIHNLPQFKACRSMEQGHVHFKERDRNLRNEAIEQLSLETGWPIEYIGPLYRWVFRELQQGAQVHDYLFVLTAKHVRRMLNKRKLPKRSD